jgi:hypothetical protein
MASSDYKIEKLEKGPLQRFKNQNLLLKKFGEVGLQVYKVITGKRTAAELRKDLDMEDAKFNEILKYMEDAGMVKLVPLGGKAGPEEEETKPEEETVPEEEIPEEEAPKPKRKPAAEEIAPEIQPEEEEEAPKPKKKPPAEEEIVPEEIQPEEEVPEEAPVRKKKPAPEEEEIAPEIQPEEEEEAPKPKKKPPAEEEAPAEEAPAEEEGEKELAPEEITFGGEEAPEKAEEESPVEKIIRDKYGDIGVQVYTLIDGQRTAEEIMDETGLSEAKLVEILDFLDEQGIIKLEYPKGKPEAAPVAEKPKEATEEFAPMIEGEEETEKTAVKDTSPVLLPAKAQVSITKWVQTRAKTMLRYGDAGDKMLSAIDGKKDVIDVALQLNLPLPRVMEMMNFAREEGGITIVPVDRAEVRKKYGEDGFSIYKRYGKEGLMLYELIGKELTIKEMAERVATDKAKVVDMFLFIYEVLGIEMPINKETLMKQLGL